MYKSVIDSISSIALSKTNFFKDNLLGFIIASILAGMFISFGSFVSMSVGGYCSQLMGPAAKIMSSFSFAAALSLVIMCGCELFTGNNIVVGVGMLSNKVSIKDCILLWAVCWLGNFIGSWMSVAMFYLAGSGLAKLVADSFNAAGSIKCSYNVLSLIFRGILCNILVCLAVWCSIKMKDETAKLLMVFWCIFVFMICGFEHSIANMSIIGTALLNGAKDVTWIKYMTNLMYVTFGNAIGGFAFVALPYWSMAKDRQ